MGDDPKLARQAALLPNGCWYETRPVDKLRREFVWGQDYIDEQVAAYNADGARTFTLQDANYNVVGRVWDGGVPLRQFSYDAYGGFLPIFAKEWPSLS